MTRRSWFDKIDDRGEHPVTAEAHRRLARSDECIDAHGRMLALADRLAAVLDDDQREVWLDLDAAINHRADLVAIEYFNVCVDKALGVLPRSGAGLDGTTHPPALALRSVAAELLRVAERIE